VDAVGRCFFYLFFVFLVFALNWFFDCFEVVVPLELLLIKKDGILDFLNILTRKNGIE
jgi:hypothetical protein